MRKKTIALRAYTVPEKQDKENSWSKNRYNLPPKIDRILVFDTETRTDLYQNLTFGYYVVYDGNRLDLHGLFYDPNVVTPKEKKILEEFSKNEDVELITLEKFREIFLNETFRLESLCIGFNLPFDLSRIAKSAGIGKYANKDGFSFEIHKDSYRYPRLIVTRATNTLSFIKWGNLPNKKRNPQGNFLDLRMAVHALTDRKRSLAKACKDFETKYKKQKISEHGKITPEYIRYCIADVKATHSLYQKVKEEFDSYDLEIPITRAYTPASIGKEFLKKIGVDSFEKKNESFPKEITGYLMNSYFGGRTECKVRREPKKVDLLDFYSMYPTVCTLQELWKFVIADRIDCDDDCVEEITKFVDEFKLEDIQDKEKWRKLPAIVQIKPDGDVLPLRARYGTGHAWNIGITEVTSKHSLWYSLADVIASKLYTGKTPKILKAIRFTPAKPQEKLQEITIHGIKVNPYKQDLFRDLIKHRQTIKDKRDTFKKKSKDWKILDRKQNIVKIIVNSISYGIYVQIDTTTRSKKAPVKVYGLTQFTNEKEKIEDPGFMFNPIIAVAITSAARLLLATTEVMLNRKDDTHAYCDTDSMVVPSKYTKEIQDFFQKINPYGKNFTEKIFKIEKSDVWFYGISAKRYCLYTIDEKTGEIKIDDEKYSSHGLGHMLNPFEDFVSGKEFEETMKDDIEEKEDEEKDEEEKDWSPEVWKDILDFHYGNIERDDIVEKYTNLYAQSKMAVTKPVIYKRWFEFNKGKDYCHQVKPSNFAIVGFPPDKEDKNKKPVKPISAFHNPPRKAVYDEFLDYNDKLGKKRYQGKEYWATFWDTLETYMRHKESKFENSNDDGVLERMKVSVSEIKHIGKETDELDLVEILGVNEDSYVEYSDRESIESDFQMYAEEILKLEPKDVEGFGIERGYLSILKEKIRNKRWKGISIKFKNKLLVALRK